MDDKILTIQKDAPVINMYSKYGEHLYKKELPEKIFERRLRFKNNEQGKDAANLRLIYVLFGSITSINNKVYLTYVDHDDNSKPYTNKVVELLYENNDFIINKVYTLRQNNTGWFTAIQPFVFIN